MEKQFMKDHAERSRKALIEGTCRNEDEIAKNRARIHDENDRNLRSNWLWQGEHGFDGRVD